MGSVPPWIENPEEIPFWVGVSESARLLKVSPVTLYRWIGNGFVEKTLEIPIYRLNNRIFLRLKPHLIGKNPPPV